MKQKGVKARKKYWKQYWESKKEDILEARRNRYKNDPEYREKMKKARENNYQRVKLPKIKMPSNILGSIHGSGMADVMVVNGVSQTMYGIDHFARVIGRSVPTIRYWEKHGIIPTTPFMKRKKLYTGAMIDAVFFALKEQGFAANIDTKKMSDNVHKSWAQIGIIKEKK